MFTKISHYGIEQYITLTLPDFARLALYVYRAYYIPLFNTFTLHAGLSSSGMTLVSHGERPWFETYFVWYRLFLLLQCLYFCSLFLIMANISIIFFSYRNYHINFNSQFIQFMRCFKDCNACKIGDVCVSCY